MPDQNENSTGTDGDAKARHALNLSRSLLAQAVARSGGSAGVAIAALATAAIEGMAAFGIDPEKARQEMREMVDGYVDGGHYARTRERHLALRRAVDAVLGDDLLGRLRELLGR